MITIPTVLILGAGVSQPFGFPSGVELCEKVIAKNRASNPLLESAGYSSEDIKSFAKTLFYSGKRSVDGFLEYRPKFTDVGKAAIAQELIEYERRDELFTRKNNLYLYLFEQLSTSPEEFAQNRLSVLTFNYDRSLEYYMFTALKNSYGIDDARATELVSSLNIIHLHGHLGLLPWQKKGDGGRRRYVSDVNAQTIKEASKGIKIIHETADNDPGFKTARLILSDTVRIIFLGFGYADANLKKLKIDPEENLNQEFLGSVKGFEPADFMTLSSRFSSRLNSSDPDWPRGYSAEFELASGLVEKLSSEEFQPESYEDEYQNRVRAMLDRKVKGQEITVSPKAPARVPIIDLMEALKQSMTTVQRGKKRAEQKTRRKA